MHSITDRNIISIINELWKYVHVYFLIVHTVTVKGFKLDVDAVNIVDSTKIHLPPHRIVWGVASYDIRPHARRCVSINGVTSIVTRATCRVMWLCCDFVERYFILRYKKKWKLSSSSIQYNCSINKVNMSLFLLQTNAITKYNVCWCSLFINSNYRGQPELTKSLNIWE